jgi:hypothetical protein
MTEVSTSATLVALVLVDVLRISGHIAEARAITDDAIAFAVAHDENAYLPELLRVRGEQRGDREAAAADYREALALARATGGRSFEARAARSLATHA